MQERLVEDWLTKVNERGFEIPFCQTLLAKGHRILRVGHSPYEDGKDVISISGRGLLNAYQLKDGDISLAEFEKHYPQIVALVESAPNHPNLNNTKRHKPFFVTTGSIKEPVKSRVKNLNIEWARRKLGPLHLIEGKQLHADFVGLSEDFWPIELPDVRGFLSLYLAKGQSDLQLEELSQLLHSLLSPTDSKAVKASRRISAANLFASYALKEFYRTQDHWSVAQGWIVTAAHIAWAAERQELSDALWRKPFDLAVGAAKTALQNLSEEALRAKALVPNTLELNDITRARATIVSGIIAAIQLAKPTRDPDSLNKAIDLVVGQIRSGQMWLWGESAVPFFLLCFWLCELGPPSGIEELLLCKLIDAIALRNRDRSDDKLPDARQRPDEILFDGIETLRGRNNNSHKSSNDASSLESLVFLASRRLLRQNLSTRWHSISHTQLYRFQPEKPHDLLLWRCGNGRETSRWFDVPQSWKELCRDAKFREDGQLPKVLRTNPDFAILFLLVYPHRLSPPLVKFLDDFFLLRT